MRTLITGGSGYFGCVLRDRLREAGHEVRIFDLVDADDRPADVPFIQGDICDPAHVEVACKGIEVIFHCVAQVPLARNRHLFDQVNREGAEILFRTARAAAVLKVIMLSSSAIYGIPDRNPVNETTPPRPVEAYGRSKVAAEGVAQRYAAEGLDITIIRPRTILGVGRLGIFQVLFEWVSEGKKVYVFGKGSNVYQFVHADDLADGCIQAAARPGATTYNMGTDRFGSMRELLEALVRHAKTGSRVASLPMGPAISAMAFLSRLRLLPFAPYHWLLFGRELYFDTTKAQTELGWKPRWSNGDMLCQSYDTYLAQRGTMNTHGARSVHRSPVKQGLLRFLKWFS